MRFLIAALRRFCDCPVFGTLSFHVPACWPKSAPLGKFFLGGYFSSSENKLPFMILNPPEKTAEKCLFPQKNAVLGGHIAGNHTKLQEGFRAQESRTLANFHKISASKSCSSETRDHKWLAAASATHHNATAMILMFGPWLQETKQKKIYSTLKRPTTKNGADCVADRRDRFRISRLKRLLCELSAEHLGECANNWAATDTGVTKGVFLKRSLAFSAFSPFSRVPEEHVGI